MWKVVLVICLTVLSNLSMALGANEAPLPADQAFRFSATFSQPKEVTASWQIAPGYYLYAKRIQITFDPPVTGIIHLPQGEYKYDDVSGRVEVFANSLNVPIQLRQPWLKVRMHVNYQGCSQDGFCYPPMQETRSLKWGETVAASTINSSQTVAPISYGQLLSDQNAVQSVLKSHSILFVLFIFFVLGLLLAFTPCVLPMLPILTSIIVGQKQIASPRKAALLSFIYVLGSALMYAIAGMIAALIGSSLQVWLQTPIVIGMMSALFVLLALSLFGFYDLQLPPSWQQHLTRLSQHQQGGTSLGVFIMGMLSALIVSPCITAPLVGVLLYISQSGSALFGASALFIMGLGMGLPLILVGASTGWLPKSGPWMEAVKSAFGLLMLAMAIWLASRILAPTMITLLWGALLIAILFFIGIYLSRLWGRANWRRSVYILMSAAGVLFFIGVLNWENVGTTTKTISIGVAENHFITVKSKEDISQQLMLARTLHKPVLLDFYADWCDSCIIMDKQVFSQPRVKAALRPYILLRVDLSANTPADQALLKEFNVIAPPTVLFFNQGQEIDSKRIVGEVNEKEFLQRLKVFKTVICQTDHRMNC
jgi:thioredoxin:protein disulfide reductase